MRTRPHVAEGLPIASGPHPTDGFNQRANDLCAVSAASKTVASWFSIPRRISWARRERRSTDHFHGAASRLLLCVTLSVETGEDDDDAQDVEQAIRDAVGAEGWTVTDVTALAV